MIKIFTGYDARESVGWHAFAQSLIETSKNYVLMPPLSGFQGDGTNAFAIARFTVPELCDWGSSPAIFVDGCDMLLRAPIQELAALYEMRYAVQVVKHNYKTKHPRKYIGTEMEAANADYERKNWSSVVIFNPSHMAHFKAREVICEAIRVGNGKFLHRFGWLKDEEIGSLPLEWNWLADEYGASTTAKLLHWTAGQPGFYHYKDAPHSHEWRQAVRNAQRGLD